MSRRLVGMAVGALLWGSGSAASPAAADTLPAGAFGTAVQTSHPVDQVDLSWADPLVSSDSTDGGYAGPIMSDLAASADPAVQVGSTSGSFCTGDLDDVGVGPAYALSGVPNLAGDADGSCDAVLSGLPSPTSTTAAAGRRLAIHLLDARKSNAAGQPRFAFRARIGANQFTRTTRADSMPSVESVDVRFPPVEPTVSAAPSAGLRFLGNVPIGFGQVTPDMTPSPTPLPAAWAGGTVLFVATLVGTARFRPARSRSSSQP